MRESRLLEKVLGAVEASSQALGEPAWLAQTAAIGDLVDAQALVE